MPLLAYFPAHFLVCGEERFRARSQSLTVYNLEILLLWSQGPCPWMNYSLVLGDIAVPGLISHTENDSSIALERAHRVHKTSYSQETA